MDAPLDRFDQYPWARVATVWLIFSFPGSAMAHFAGMRQLQPGWAASCREFVAAIHEITWGI
jgi:hypothetical protein